MEGVGKGKWRKREIEGKEMEEKVGHLAELCYISTLIQSS